MSGHTVELDTGSVETPAWPGSYDGEAETRVGFFTDTSVCIGCKACEVACKEWNQVPPDPQGFTATSYDNSGELGANRWRHVAFIEQKLPVGVEGGAPDSWVEEAARQQLLEQGVPAIEEEGFRWLMSSDVCKHCTEAGCLDGCPTGSIFRTEYGTVVVQEDICNGCGYCVVACPFGVLDQREDDGRVWKCTLCYDRLRDDMEPACAQACPTDSIQYGPLDELRERAAKRVEKLHGQGHVEARLYGESPEDGVGGFGAFFLLLDDPETYRLPPDPVVPTRHSGSAWSAAAGAAAALGAGIVASFLARSR